MQGQPLLGRATLGAALLPRSLRIRMAASEWLPLLLLHDERGTALQVLEPESRTASGVLGVVLGGQAAQLA